MKVGHSSVKEKLTNNCLQHWVSCNCVLSNKHVRQLRIQALVQAGQTTLNFGSKPEQYIIQSAAVMAEGIL